MKNTPWKRKSTFHLTVCPILLVCTKYLFSMLFIVGLLASMSYCSGIILIYEQFQRKKCVHLITAASGEGQKKNVVGRTIMCKKN
jgi:hypothetical protein